MLVTQPYQPQITYVFENVYLMDVFDTTGSSVYIDHDWTEAQNTFLWMMNFLNEDVQKQISRSEVTRCQLFRCTRSDAYIYTLQGERLNLVITIRDQWARNFAGPLFESVKPQLK